MMLPEIVVAVALTALGLMRAVGPGLVLHGVVDAIHFCAYF